MAAHNGLLSRGKRPFRADGNAAARPLLDCPVTNAKGFSPGLLLIRSVCTILLVAAIGRGFAGYEETPRGPIAPTDWIRTADGWEHRSVLSVVPPPPPPTLHPAVVGAFQLGFSLMVLLAFPRRTATTSPAQQTNAYRFV